MIFNIEIHQNEIPQVFERFVAITGVEPWRHRFEEIARWLKNNPLLRDYVEDRHGLEMELAQLIIEIESNQGQFPISISSPYRYKLFAFMAAVTSINKKLSNCGKRRLKGMLTDGLKQSTGLLPLEVEIMTAVHLCAQGFEVDFQDMEGIGRADFLARRNDTVLEIECCLVSGDIGRAVHRREAAQLGYHVLQQLDQPIKSITEGLLVLLQIKRRLGSKTNMQQQIASDIINGIVSGTPRYESELCTVSVRTFKVQDSPFRKIRKEGYNKRDISDFVAQLIGQRNSEILFHFTPGKRVFALVIEGQRSDKVLKGIDRQISGKGKSQFSKKYPGVLIARLHDLTGEQLLNLADTEGSIFSRGNGLQWVATEFFKEKSRNHMMSLVFLANSRLQRTSSRVDEIETMVTSGIGPAYIFHSKTHLAAKDPNFRIFQSWCP
ncbi:MAG: hypothetical protein HY356_09225 [Gammaproteobacteria bacterium]|nr:hypothetical protein [Gammaproteobacteria bacterium]